MGIECPECGRHGAYVAAITATGEPAKKNSDIIARKLSCGHVIGSRQYMAYRKELASLDESEANAVRQIHEKNAKARLAIWAKIAASTQEA